MKFQVYVGTLPVKRGDIVTIRKGTTVKTVYYGERLAGKTYKVKVDHILCGQEAYGRSEKINPSIVWAGPGGYWSSVDINDVIF